MYMGIYTLNQYFNLKQPKHTHTTRHPTTHTHNTHPQHTQHTHTHTHREAQSYNNFMFFLS